MRKSSLLAIAALGYLLSAGCTASNDDNSLGDTPQCSIPKTGQRSFSVANLKYNRYDCIQAVEKGSGSGTTNTGYNFSFKIFVDAGNDTVLNNMNIAFIAEMKSKVQAIIKKNIEVFGTPPDPVRTSERDIFFLVTDIQDKQTDGSYVAGFFDSTNSTAGSPSNEVNMLVMDGVQPFEKPDRVLDFFNTLAHEFEHLIHYNYDPHEETWVDEGMAEMASDVNRSATERSLFDPDSTVSCNIGHTVYYNCEITGNTNISLPEWSSETRQYSKSSLFFKYLCEKEGVNCEATLGNIVASAQNGIALHGIPGVEEALKKTNSQTALYQNLGSADYSILLSNQTIADSQNFSAIFQSWLVAMSHTAFNNFAGSNDIPQGSLNEALGPHRYKSFMNLYPFWMVNSTDPTLPLTYGTFAPFSAKYIYWKNQSHPSSSFSSDFDQIKMITVSASGTVNFQPANDLSGFQGMQIIYNINPYYSGEGTAEAKNTTASGSPVDTISVSAKVSQGIDATGNIISIGNVPFTELSLRLEGAGDSLALEGDLAEQLKGYMGRRVKLNGYLTGELSKRGQLLFWATGYELK